MLIERLWVGPSGGQHDLHVATFTTAAAVLRALDGQRAALAGVGGPFKLHESIVQQEGAGGRLAAGR